MNSDRLINFLTIPVVSICLMPLFVCLFVDSELHLKLSKSYKELRFLVDLRRKSLSESKIPNELKPLVFFVIGLMGYHILTDIDIVHELCLFLTIEHYLVEPGLRLFFVLLFTKILMNFLLGSWIQTQITHLRLIIQFINETGHILCELIESRYNIVQQEQILDEKSVVREVKTLPRLKTILPQEIEEEIEVYNLTLPTNPNKAESALVNSAFTGAPESIHINTNSTTTTTTTGTELKEVNKGV